MPRNIKTILKRMTQECVLIRECVLTQRNDRLDLMICGCKFRITETVVLFLVRFNGASHEWDAGRSSPGL